jgi:hypothetical protein
MERLAILRCGNASTLGKDTIESIPQKFIFEAGNSENNSPMVEWDCGTSSIPSNETQILIYDSAPA